MTSVNTLNSSLAQSSVGTTMRQSKSKSKISISLSRPQKTHQSRKSSSDGESGDLNCELSKLFDIAQRCQAYFDKYVEEHQHEVEYTKLMFDELVQFLQHTFASLFESMQIKKRELLHSIEDKKIEFLTVKDLQFESLQKKLSNVKIIQSECKGLQRHNEDNLSIFAASLNEFYERIEQIEKVNYRENIRESINFLHRLIQDQSSSGFLHQNDNQLLFDPTETPVSISFNNDQLFSVRDQPKKESQKWEQMRALIEADQRKREQRVKQYGSISILAM